MRASETSTSNSKSNWQERAEKVIAQGCCTYSKRSDQYVEGVYPTHCFHGYNEKLCTTEGMYTDMICGLGSNLINIQNNYTLPTTDEVRLAERLVTLFPCIDKLKFLKTGSEACQAAVRIARAYNPQDPRLGDRGIGTGYHGWHNWCIASEKPGVGCVDELYAKFPSIKTLVHYLSEPLYEAISYCIIEPITLDLSIKRIAELRKLRKLCTEHKIILIFDEAVTGFRTPMYCMANFLGIQPDLIVLGKAMANGYPLAVVGGRRELMDTPDYFISSTFAGEHTSIDAALQVLDYLSDEKLEELWKRGARFQRDLNRLLPKDKLQLIGIPTRATWKGDELYKALFWQEMCKQKVLFGKAWFITFAHTRYILQDVLKKASQVIKHINAGKVKLEGKMPQEVFKRF